MRHAPAIPVLLCAALLGAPGCARKSVLADAYYASSMVPTYPHAELRDVMGGTTTGDEPGAEWESTSWFLDSKDDADKIVTFYQGKLGGWQKEVDENGETRFTTVPQGGEAGEEVYVVVRPGGEIQIGESVKAGKKKHNRS